MKDYQKRVVKEKQDLDIKIKGLMLFIFSDVFNNLEECEKFRLIDQREAMVEYSDILGYRICGF